MPRLKRVGRHDLTVYRRRHGRGFGYTDANGDLVRDPEITARARELVIPPAWTDVRQREVRLAAVLEASR